tara:strand:- start:2511 stop:2762 length:252 start_codon:yes stop_codon:yes gene_type:complete
MSNLILEIEALDLADIDLLQCLTGRTVSVRYETAPPVRVHVDFNEVLVERVEDDGLLLRHPTDNSDYDYELVRWEGITKVIYH